MGEAPLDRPGVVALVCEGVADGMAEHLGVRLGLKLGTCRRTFDNPGEAGRGEGCSPLADKHGYCRRAFPLEPRNVPQLAALDRTGVRRAMLGPRPWSTAPLICGGGGGCCRRKGLVASRVTIIVG
jgi:hypothetical protein